MLFFLLFFVIANSPKCINAQISENPADNNLNELADKQNSYFSAEFQDDGDGINLAYAKDKEESHLVSFKNVTLIQHHLFKNKQVLSLFPRLQALRIFIMS